MENPHDKQLYFNMQFKIETSMTNSLKLIKIQKKKNSSNHIKT